MKKLKSVQRLMWSVRDCSHVLWTVGGFLFGFLFVLLVMMIVRPDTYVTFGTYCALMVNGVFTLFGTLLIYTQNYKELIHYGTSRRIALFGTTVSALGLPIGLTVLMIPINLLERALFEGIFGAAQEVAMTAGGWVIAIIAILAVWLFGGIAAICFHKFGVNGMTAIYFVCLALSLLLARFGDVLIEVIATNISLVIVGSLIVYAIVTTIVMRSLYKTSV